MEKDATHNLTEITEGDTRLLVPAGALTEMVPPRDVAFFNPKAHANRDISTAAYMTFLEKFNGYKSMLEPLSGIGARGLRAINETGTLQYLFINDTNPNATNLAKRSAHLNCHPNQIEYSNLNACQFLAQHSTKGARGAIVDIDPFGSPAPFFDCAARAVANDGMLSFTATDQQVLNGLFNISCKNKYGGIPIRGTTYGSETAIRLVLGCLRTVTARLDLSMYPLFVEADMHYYRMYVRINKKCKSDAESEIGYSVHCHSCGYRRLVPQTETRCGMCNADTIVYAGPLWRGHLLDAGFVRDTSNKMRHIREPNKMARRRLEMSLEEAAVQEGGPFYTVDEVASRTRSSPIRIDRVVEKLRDAGFAASRTALSFTGFRTTAPLDVINGIFR